jgi:hypothetical protein
MKPSHVTAGRATVSTKLPDAKHKKLHRASPSYASAEMVIGEKEIKKENSKGKENELEIVVSKRLAMQCTNSRVDRRLGGRELRRKI